MVFYRLEDITWINPDLKNVLLGFRNIIWLNLQLEKYLRTIPNKKIEVNFHKQLYLFELETI